MAAIYVVSVTAAPGMEDHTEESFKKLGEFLKGVDGYKGGHMLRARNGAFMEALHAFKGTTPGAAEEGHGEGTNFIIVEIWENEAARVPLSGLPGYAEIHKDNIKGLLPAHTHEFYRDFGGH
jgi:hypothetical protein